MKKKIVFFLILLASLFLFTNCNVSLVLDSSTYTIYNRSAYTITIVPLGNCTPDYEFQLPRNSSRSVTWYGEGSTYYNIDYSPADKVKPTVYKSSGTIYFYSSNLRP